MQSSMVLRVGIRTGSQGESYLTALNKKRGGLLKRVEGLTVKALTVLKNGRSCLGTCRKMAGEYRGST